MNDNISETQRRIDTRIQAMYERYEMLLSEDNISSYKVSHDTGISQTVLSNWKCGKSVPKIPILIQLAEYFNVSLDYFIKIENDDVKDTQNDEMFRKIKRGLNKYSLTNKDVEFILTTFKLHKQLK